jgi:hypothetical protein
MIQPWTQTSQRNGATLVQSYGLRSCFS